MQKHKFPHLCYCAVTVFLVPGVLSVVSVKSTQKVKVNDVNQMWTNV